jgi:hypothetical protein
MARPFIILFCVLICVTCTEENTYITNETKPTEISGTVWAWSCGIGEPYADSNNPRPFTDVAQYKPEFKILYANGTRDSFTLDDNSQFRRFVGPGQFTLVMSNRYSWPPDTLLMSLEGDSIIDFHILRRVLEPDTLIVTLSSIWSLDTARPIRDLETIGLLYGVRTNFATFPSHLRTVTQSGGKFHRIWRLPLWNTTLNMVLVYELAVAAIAADPVRLGQASVWANGFYECTSASNLAKIAPHTGMFENGMGVSE